MFGVSVGLWVVIGVEKCVCAVVGSAYVILYLNLMVDMILVSSMNPSVVRMMENVCYHILDE